MILELVAGRLIAKHCGQVDTIVVLQLALARV